MSQICHCPTDLVAYYRFDQASGTVASDEGSQPANGNLRNFSAPTWRTSGAALGDASTYAYQSTWPVNRVVALATATGDSAIVGSVSAGSRGVQVYAVNTSPSIAPPVATAGRYFSVFTASSPVATSTYTMRLRPASNPDCLDTYGRASNEQPWTLTTGLARTSTSFVLPPATYRSEDIAVNRAVAVIGDSLLCAGATTTLTAVASGGSGFVWSTGATTAALPNVGPGTYTVQVRFPSGCVRTTRRTVRTITVPSVIITGDSLICPGTTTTLTATASTTATYAWSTGATTAALPFVGPGTYILTVTYGTGCTRTMRRTVRVQPVPTLTITGDSLLCPATTTTLTASVAGATSYRWNTGATTATLPNIGPGTYIVTAMLSSGCSLQSQRVVRQLTVTSSVISGDSLLCTGGATTSLTVNVAGSPSFLWNTGATTALLSNVGPGTYTVQLRFPTGCVQTIRRTVRVLAAPALTITGESALCAGTTITLTAAAAGATSFRWSTGATTASVAVNQPGNYYVTATYGAGCVLTTQREVRPLAALPPTFTLGADTLLCEGDRLLLRGPIDSGLRYIWSDGSTAPNLLVSTSGTYTLQIFTLCGEQTATRNITTQSCLTIPNVITPNGDLDNEQLVIAGLFGEGWNLEVYNRWGRSVFATANYHNDWGHNVSPGVYYLYLRRPTTGYLYKGWVEVIR